MTAKTKAKTNSVPPGLKRLRKSANAETIRTAVPRNAGRETVAAGEASSAPL
jgi:hypothetical protein